MKEKLEIAEKSVLLSIPYLIVLSLAYYWGYWGYFGIDAISYYGVQDLIKGFAYSLPAVLLLNIVFIIGDGISTKAIFLLRKRFGAVASIIIMLVPASFLYFLFKNITSPDTIIYWELFGFIYIFISLISNSLLSVVAEEWQWAIDNTKLFFAIKWVVIISCASLLSSYSYGRHEAHNISNNRQFSYMQLDITADSSKSKSIFKYLGKAGDSYFFISPDNKEKRIIATRIIPTLVLHEYDKSDSASIHAYNIFSGRK